MRCFWEQTGVLGPIYRLLGQGLNDRRCAGSHRGEGTELRSLDSSFLEPEESARVSSIRFRCSVILPIA